MKKFEYKRIYREVGYRELDMIGEAGWELVAVQPSKTDDPPTLWFKREKQEVKIRHKMGTVVSIANPRFQPLQPGQLSYQQPQDKIVDLEVSVDGVSSTFVVRENMTVEVRNDITISCDRDPILNEINAIMRNSNDILNSVDKHKSILEDCEQIVKDLNPVLAVDKSRDEKIANLEKSVSGINDSIEGLKELILGLNKKE